MEEAAEEAPGAHLWAQESMDTARRLEGFWQQQEQIKHKMSAQERLAWREEDIRACVERVVEGRCLQPRPFHAEGVEQIIARETSAAVARAANGLVMPSHVCD